eukprot:366446-Chlamydomonas_euryale.AAC.5
MHPQAHTLPSTCASARPSTCCGRGATPMATRRLAPPSLPGCWWATACGRCRRRCSPCWTCSHPCAWALAWVVARCGARSRRGQRGAAVLCSRPCACKWARAAQCSSCSRHALPPAAPLARVSHLELSVLSLSLSLSLFLSVLVLRFQRARHDPDRDGQPFAPWVVDRAPFISSGAMAEVAEQPVPPPSSNCTL